MNDSQFYDLNLKVARSSIAIIDAIVQRGAFKGEELSTVGGLRDQCVQLIQATEEREQEAAENEEEEE
ncbi:hypothetical protein OAA38_00095 [bacterium]|jgi:hypothetical protein|nr:hypothetical protein [bacterium]|tara:strand:+ start:463 stop:666 length:204 start_codon:yes stop_codon:yes gene_type:complete